MEIKTAVSCDLSSGRVIAAQFFSGLGEISISKQYIQHLLDTCQVHEYHIWDFSFDKQGNLDHWKTTISQVHDAALATFDAADSQWRKQRALFFQYYACNLADNDVFMKLDQDIAFIDIPGFQAAVDRRRREASSFLMFPNIVNNGVASFYQQQRGCIPTKLYGVNTTMPYPSEEDNRFAFDGGAYRPGLEGWLLSGPMQGVMSNLVHDSFLRNPGCFKWTDRSPSHCPKHENTEGILHYGSQVDHCRQGRFSINAFLLLGKDAEKLSTLVHEGLGDDEYALTELAAAKEYKNVILTNFTMVHLAFGGPSKNKYAKSDWIPAYMSLAFELRAWKKMEWTPKDLNELTRRSLELTTVDFEQMSEDAAKKLSGLSGQLPRDFIIENMQARKSLDTVKSNPFSNLLTCKGIVPRNVKPSAQKNSAPSVGLATVLS
jgi:hypothetical protein